MHTRPRWQGVRENLHAKEALVKLLLGLVQLK